VTSTLLYNIGELTTNDPTAGDGTALGRLHDAAMVFNEGRVAWVGSTRDAPAADEGVDCEQRAVIPGFVDSHTHLVFDGERSDEFAARMAGTAYVGGIMRTVDVTRVAATSSLQRSARERLGALRLSGVTTVEIKSGYELNVDGEVRLLEVANSLSDEVTFLGAHAVPREFTHDRDAYVALVGGAMLDACAPLAKWADVFCDRDAFSVDEAAFVLERSREVGLQLRVHGNQRGDTGGVALAVKVDAASVDHCSFVNDGDLEQLAASSTVATLLPGAEFSTKSPYPSARRLIDAGVTVALATDCNPGTSYTTSMPFVVALAVRELAMTPDEALWAATRGGSRALRRDDVGALSVGARADAVVLDLPAAAHVAYRPGSDHVRTVFRGGQPS
jgi:imidazolonepropionase